MRVQRNDTADAKSIATAARRPIVHHGVAKTEAQQTRGCSCTPVTCWGASTRRRPTRFGATWPSEAAWPRTAGPGSASLPRCSRRETVACRRRSSTLAGYCSGHSTSSTEENDGLNRKLRRARDFSARFNLLPRAAHDRGKPRPDGVSKWAAASPQWRDSPGRLRHLSLLLRASTFWHVVTARFHGLVAEVSIEFNGPNTWPEGSLPPVVAAIRERMIRRRLLAKTCKSIPGGDSHESGSEPCKRDSIVCRVRC